MIRFSLLILALSISFLATAQDLESELGFIYVKADYLLETNRFEEAIFEFNKIIEQDPTYKDALFKRASAKFTVGAFAGAKKDLLLSFDVIGITPESVLLMGQTQKNMGENDAANVSLATAAKLFPTESVKKSSPSKRMPTNREKNEDKPVEETTTKDTTTTEKEKSTGEKIKDGLNELDEKVNDIMDDILGKDKNQDVDDSGSNTNPPAEEEDVYVPDMSVNEIYVDEDLTIFIQDGLGGRTILEQPNILILSETSGEVAVDVCVNANGKVTSAVFNKDRSTLSIQSLISLAVRKSREFWFEAGNPEELCGSIIFRITGRT